MLLSKLRWRRITMELEMRRLPNIPRVLLNRSASEYTGLAELCRRSCNQSEISRIIRLLYCAFTFRTTMVFRRFSAVRVLFELVNNKFINQRKCPWCNGFHHRKWTRRREFKSWTRLIAFHIALIPLGKVWIQLFSLQLWVNSRADWFPQPWWGN